MEIQEINYLSEPKKFSNRCLVNIGMIDHFCLLFDGEYFEAEDLINLSILVQAIVFNESLIVVDDLGVVESGENYPHLASSTSRFLKLLEDDNIIDLRGIGNTGNDLMFEACLLSFPFEEPVKIFFMHDSNILIQRNQKWENYDLAYLVQGYRNPKIKLQGDVQNLSDEEIILSKWDKSFKEAYEKFSIGKFTVLSSFPWKLLSHCHGIPYISDNFYTLKEIKSEAPTNIGHELYRKLEELHKSYFREVRKYLGPTYVYLPPLISILLQECNTIDDIPNKLIQLRKEYNNFRKKCTDLEIELRNAKNMKSQFEIIKEIETSYNSLKTKAGKPNYRLIMRLFDIVKKIDPIQMGIETLSQIKDVIIEEEGLIKIPGYYNLWQASLEAEQGYPLIKRVFGSQLSPDFFVDMNNLMRGLPESIIK